MRQISDEENSRVAQGERSVDTSSLRAGGSTPSSVSTKREQWPCVGVWDDVLRICPKLPDYVSVWFDPHCPRCGRSKHPNVTRSNSHREERHCNHCKIRWVNSSFQPFISCHGNPESVIRKLVQGQIQRSYYAD